jgi:hypothetical protein
MLGKVLKTTTAPPRGPERDVTRASLAEAIANRDEKSSRLDAAQGRSVARGCDSRGGGGEASLGEGGARRLASRSD